MPSRLVHAALALVFGSGACTIHATRSGHHHHIQSGSTSSTYTLGGFTVDLSDDDILKVAHVGTGQVVLETLPSWLAVGTASEIRQPVSAEGGYTLVEKVHTKTDAMTITDAALSNDDTLTLMGSLSGGGFAEGDVTFSFNLTTAGAATANQLRFSAHVDISDCVDSTRPTSCSATVPNRFFFTHASAEDEQVLGFGSQYSEFNLKGKYVPILSTEQGIGRGLQPITAALNVGGGGSGGSWHTTYTAIPAYLTPEGRALMLENTEYCAFDLESDADRIEIEVWSMALEGQVMAAAGPLELLTEITEVTGRMAPLPAWVQSGAIVGLEGGRDVVSNITDTLLAADVPIAALWLQDWSGINHGNDGDRVWWNWEADDGEEGSYPGWNDFVDELKADHGIRMMTYINPYFANDVSEKPSYNRNYYQEGIDNGYFVKNSDGEAYLLNSGHFDFGTLDLTNPAARAWLKSMVQDNMVRPGESGGVYGWMNDFGEYLPFDAVLYSGEDAAAYHNRYPQEWSDLVAEAVEETGMSDEVVFFSRSAAMHSPKNVPLFWMGDQMVSWDDKDGIKTALAGMLTSGLTGRTLAHSDIGGFTVVSEGRDFWPWNYQRSKELLLRWIELSAFSDVVFRTHPGLILDGTAQVYDDEESMAHFAKFARVHSALFEYRQPLIAQASTLGYPVTRPMLLHYPTDKVVRDDTNRGLIEQFMLGDALLVAPVMDQGAESVRAYLPADASADGCEWVHLWSNATYASGEWAEVDAPLGQPGVWFRTGDEQGEAIQAALLAL
mmetsp:Transcript_35559/g.82332  ORF Transcript_35559/g.82332 Transcript_35559/m.82332 type:complete len:781 (+) Transcript_35559:115-2457(+)